LTPDRGTLQWLSPVLSDRTPPRCRTLTSQLRSYAGYGMGLRRAISGPVLVERPRFMKSDELRPIKNMRLASGATVDERVRARPSPGNDGE